MLTPWLLMDASIYLAPFWAKVRKYTYELFVVTVGTALLFAFSFPNQVVAEVPVFGQTSADQEMVALYVDYMQNFSRHFGVLPDTTWREPTSVMIVPATAYTSDPYETDDTPFITASNSHVRHGIIAANFLTFGTQVRIPEIYGNEIFVVEDRMNKRYDKRIDIWMEEKVDAREFGIKQVKIEIF